MIKIVTWLLGFSSAIIGFIASGRAQSFWATVLLIVLGGSVSILAALTALLYGGYAARNWVIADRIAENYNWTELRPDYDLSPRFNAFPLSLAKPCQDKIALVFWIFFDVSIISLGAHIALLSHVALSCYKQASPQVWLLTHSLAQHCPDNGPAGPVKLATEGRGTLLEIPRVVT